MWLGLGGQGKEFPGTSGSKSRKMFTKHCCSFPLFPQQMISYSACCASHPAGWAVVRKSYAWQERLWNQALKDGSAQWECGEDQQNCRAAVGKDLSLSLSEVCLGTNTSWWIHFTGSWRPHNHSKIMAPNSH